MFENVIVNRSDPQALADPGVLAECLLFYQNVHLVLDRGHLSNLVKVIGIDNLYRLLDGGFASATFLRDFLGVHTNQNAGIETHQFIAFTLEGHKEKKHVSREEYLRESLTLGVGDAHLANKWTKKLLPKLAIRRIGSDFSSEPITTIATQDVEDQAYLLASVQATLRELVPGYQPKQGDEFQALNSPQGLVIGTNLDFVAINREYHKVVPVEHSSITAAYLLSHLLTARADIALASHYGGDIVTMPQSSQIIRLKFADILRRRSKNIGQIELFQEATLENARALRETINDGKKSFGEFIDLLEHARRFKEWLKGAHPDAVVLKEYYDAVSKETWLDKLGGKVARFVFFTAAGIAVDAVVPTGLGTAGGLAVGATDSFIVDRIVRGWRPNQFVENNLKPFVDER